MFGQKKLNTSSRQNNITDHNPADITYRELHPDHQTHPLTWSVFALGLLAVLWIIVSGNTQALLESVRSGFNSENSESFETIPYLDEAQKLLCENTGGTYQGCPPCPEGSLCKPCDACRCPAGSSFNSAGCQLDNAIVNPDDNLNYTIYQDENFSTTSSEPYNPSISKEYTYNQEESLYGDAPGVYSKPDSNLKFTFTHRKYDNKTQLTRWFLEVFSGIYFPPNDETLISAQELEGYFGCEGEGPDNCADAEYLVVGGQETLHITIYEYLTVDIYAVVNPVPGYVTLFEFTNQTSGIESSKEEILNVINSKFVAEDQY